jgi:hypothetical protein
MKILEKLIILDGAMAMDGGSISLMGKDFHGNAIQIDLDWSLDAQINGTTKLSLNKIPLEKKSREEEKFLKILDKAEIQLSEEQGRRDSEPIQGAAWGEDINQYLSGIAEGAEAALRNLIDQLISNVTSKRHVGVEPLNKQTDNEREFDGPCSICGKPGYVQAHPSDPVSVIRCEEHSGTRTFNPISILMNVIVLLGIGLLLYLVFILVKKLFW